MDILIDAPGMMVTDSLNNLPLPVFGRGEKFDNLYSLDRG